jgi:hypothetical protein
VVLRGVISFQKAVPAKKKHIHLSAISILHFWKFAYRSKAPGAVCREQQRLSRLQKLSEKLCHHKKQLQSYLKQWRKMH